MTTEVKKQIPDTLLLEERAKLAMNAIIGMADEDHEYIPFFNATLVESPAFMTHGSWDYGSSHGRLIDAATLARHMSGVEDGKDIEAKYKENLLSFFREDGLSYRGHLPRKDWEGKYANLIDQRAVILSLTSWYMESKDPKVKEAADRHVAALKRIAIKERDVWYFPASEYSVDGWPSPNAVNLRLAPDPASFCGRLIMPLLKYHELTGNKDAFELCRFFTALIVEKSGIYNEDGSFNDSLAYRSGHFHTRIGTLDGLARFGAFTKDASLLHFVKKSLDWVRTKTTAFGWTPGDLQEQQFEHETCSLVDMIATGITLAQNGYSEYWGVVEKYLRNHLTETQLTDLEWVKDLDHKNDDIVGRKTFYNVAKRTQGAFAGYSAPNDFVCDVNHGRGHTSDLQTCCIGSGTRGLYMGWSNIVTEHAGIVRVNLLLSRATRWLDIDSHLPHEGRLDLTINEEIEELHVRIPDWAGFHKVRIHRQGANGEAIVIKGSDDSLWVNKCFVNIGHVSPGEQITVIFPMSEYKTVEKAVGQEFVTTWRGDDVIYITPEGKHNPLYNNRKVYDKAPMKEGSYLRVDHWVW